MYDILLTQDGVPTVPPTIGAAPTGLTATADADSIALGWTNGDTYTATVIQRKSTGDFDDLAIAAGNAVSYDDTSAIAGTTYTYRVRGLKSGYPTPYSNEASDVVPVSAGHSVGSVGTNNILLTGTDPVSLRITNTDTIIIGCWVNVDTAAGNGFLTKSDSLDHSYTLGTDGLGKPFFDCLVADGVTDTVTAVSALSTGTRYFLLAWKNPATTTLNIKINNIATVSLDYSADSGVFSSPDGDLYLMNNGENSLKLVGKIDEIFVCKNPPVLATALTAINTSIYAAGVGVPYASLSGAIKTSIGLQNWWTVDEASGTRFDSENSVDLTPTGAITVEDSLVG